MLRQLTCLLALTLAVPGFAAESSIVVYPQDRQIFRGFGGFAGKGVGWNVNYSQSGSPTNQAVVSDLHDKLYADMDLRFLRLNLDTRFFETFDANRAQKPDYDNAALNDLTSQIDMAYWAKQRNQNIAVAYSVWRPPHFMRQGNQGIVVEGGTGHNGFHWWFTGGEAQRPATLDGFWTDRTLTNNRLADADATKTAFANYLVAFCQRYRQLYAAKSGGPGLYPEYLAIQNEPDIDPTTEVGYDGCTYTPEDYAAIAIRVRAAFDAAGITTKLFGPEFSYPSGTNDVNYVNNVFSNYYKRFMAAAGSAVEFGAVHSYEFGTVDAEWVNNGDGFDYRGKEMWHTEFSFSSKGNTDFHPNLTRTSSLYGKMVAARIRKLFASTFWVYSLALPENDNRLDEALMLHNGNAGNNVRMTSLQLTKSYYALKQMANAITPGSYVQNMAFNWNSGGEFDAGATNVGGTMYPDAAALKRPDGRHVILVANPRPTQAISGANLAITIAALSAAGTQEWEVRITDDTRDGAVVSTCTFVNGVADPADILIPARSVVTFLEPATAGAPVITTQPSATTVTAGQDAVFTVTATGTGVTYQWRRNGTPISGATGASYTLTAAQLSDSGAVFSVAVTANATTVVSSGATLTVNPAAADIPVITTQPVSLSRAAGTQASFSVVATGQGTLTYQWRKDGTPLSDGPGIQGATSAMLSLSNLVDGSAGTYSVVVSDGDGDTVTSSGAVLTILAPGAGGLRYRLFDDVTFTNQIETGVHGTVDFWANLATQPSLTDNFSIRWTGAVVAPTTGTYTFRLRFDDFCTAWFDGVQFLAKTSHGSAGVDVSAGGWPTYEKLLTVDLVAGQAYNIRIDYVEVVDNAIFQLKWTPPGGSEVVVPGTALFSDLVAPRITTAPLSQTVASGSDASFSVVAAGDVPLTYQWYKNGTPISGATAATYTKTGVSISDAGPYTVVVSGGMSGLTTTSAEAILTVSAPAAPPAITVEPLATTTVNEGADATFTVTATGTALTYQWFRAGVAIAGATSATYVRPAVPMSDDNIAFTVVVGGSGGPSVTSSAALLDVVPAAPVITTQPVGLSVTVGQDAQFSVTASGTALTYQWQRDGVAIGGATAASYTLTAAQLADSGAAFSVVVTRHGVSTTSSSVVLTVTVGATPPVITTQPSASLTVDEGQPATVTVAASGTGLSYQWRRNGTPISGATAASYTLPAAAMSDDGAVFTVVVSGAVGSPVTSTGTTLSVTPLAPVIVIQPADTGVVTGTTATFTVVASGSSLSYQWRRDGTPISGATGTSYALSDAQLADSGATFSVTITRHGMTTTSRAAALTVTATAQPPVITGVLPTTVTVALGEDATLSVTATGTGLTYQWFRNGTLISGAVQATYTINDVTLSEDGVSYTVVISGTVPPALTSSAMTIRVSGGTVPGTSVAEVSANPSLPKTAGESGQCGAGGIGLILAGAALAVGRLRRRR
jgi:O-glycosyl hydrolase